MLMMLLYEEKMENGEQVKLLGKLQATEKWQEFQVRYGALWS